VEIEGRRLGVQHRKRNRASWEMQNGVEGDKSGSVRNQILVA
jgi:hypothetical protein